MRGIRRILQRQRQAYYLSPDMTVRDAARYFREKNIGAAAVVDEERRVIGICSERDIVYKVVAQKLNPDMTLVSDIMSRDVVTGRESDTLEESYERMCLKGSRHLPIVDEHRCLIGMVSMRDILALMLEKKEDELQFCVEIISHS